MYAETFFIYWAYFVKGSLGTKIHCVNALETDFFG